MTRHSAHARTIARLLAAAALLLTPGPVRAQFYGTQGMEFAATAIAVYREHAAACGFAPVVGEAIAATDRYWEREAPRLWQQVKADGAAAAAFAGNGAGLLSDGTVAPCAARAEIVRMGVLPVLLLAAPELLGAITRLDKGLR